MARARRQARETDVINELLTLFNSFPQRSRRVVFTLAIFEAWNLLVIAVSLVGFNYVPAIASSDGRPYVIWAVAILTVFITGYSVLAWTRE